MQKKLEAELISIAHRILKLKNKSELDQLYLETGKLYEKLMVLRFLETHFSEAKPTIGHAEISDKLAVVFDESEAGNVPGGVEKPEEQPQTEIQEDEITEETPEEEIPEVEEPQPDETEEPENDKIEDPKKSPETKTEDAAEQIDSVEEEAEAVDEEHEIQETEETEEEVSGENKEEDFKPSFELSFEGKEETEDKNAPKQISFEDLLGGHDYNDDIFERAGAKKEEVAIEPEPVREEIKEVAKPEVPQYQSTSIDKSEYEKPSTSFNGKTISFGLNDRIGFEKHLFGGSSEDMNRVISQLNTFNSFQEAQDFIDDMVKPDYNNWENKDDYALRFMEVVEKKFS